MAFCANCGNQMGDTATACSNCGQQVGQQRTPSGKPMTGMRTDGTAIASLVLGVLGIGCLVFSIVAIVLGSQAKTKIAADPSLEGEGLAKAGVILGWVGIGLNILLFLAFFGGLFAVWFIPSGGF